MDTKDMVNGSFELVSGLLLFTNVYRLWKDKRLLGVNVTPTVVFTLWGYWNLWYYPALNQTLSFVGGIVVVVANTVWLALAYKYRRQK